ncbi:TetR family transcriptional regulator [Bailinhaonella thermotolerans]|uniref:TetR family transcriptional regulator n=1 Tax=Bailinhaonella thermotolerans TaxID=1070861 RepID=A0A3A4B0Q7_9ACTN|nr:TetR family transcriptional regulator [Bailinhaonella thermotolerans]RJL31693.1 TetR family transcriptional regulator [Bailinhaonella thermotolerans]
MRTGERGGRAGGGAGTRERLIAAAEELFAEEGVDAVSLREIVRASGARNVTALQYHFGDREGLVAALLAKHHAGVDARRHALLDAARDPSLRDLAAILVRPLAAKLADTDGGPAYLRIQAELMNRARPWIDPAALDDPSNSMYRWRMMVAPHLTEDALRLHRRFVAYRFTVGELARRARTAPHTDDRLFTEHLIDLVTALLATPPSPETLRLEAEKQAGRPPAP